MKLRHRLTWWWWRLRGEATTCRACGAPYHKSWGWICPNCSGAD